LSRRRDLEVHAAERAALAVVGKVRLGDQRLQALRLELVLAEGAGKEAPRILATLELDHERALELRLLEDHEVSFGSRASESRAYRQASVPAEPRLRKSAALVEKRDRSGSDPCRPRRRRSDSRHPGNLTATGPARRDTRRGVAAC